MNISVIIPTYKRSNDLPRLFESLYNQETPPNEILVVIGPGDSESVAIGETWQKKLPTIQIIFAKKPSTIHALNLGLSNSKEDILCLLDDDVWLPQNWAARIITAFEDNKILGGFGGRDHLQIEQTALSNPPLAEKVGVYTWSGGLIGNHHCGIINSPASVDILKGCNLAFRRSAFKIMHIDDALESQGAETCWEIDICQQIKRAGFNLIYDNENYVLHFASVRLNFDDRADIFSPAWSRRVFNDAFVTAKYRSLFEVVFSALRGFIKGSRNVPGLIWAVLLLPKYGITVLKLPLRYASFIFKGISSGRSRRTSIGLMP